VLAWDCYAYVNNSPINYNDPTGHDVGCTAANPDCLGRNGLTKRSKVEMKLAVIKKLKNNGWDRVPVVADVRGIVRGAQVAKWAAEQPEFMKQQNELQSWYGNCYGQCHYAETIKNNPSLSLAGGPMPETPLVDTYSEGMGEIGGNVIDLGLTAATTKISLSGTQIFSHGGTGWHLGLETSKNMNIVHMGNHPEYGTHIAFGAIRPFVANLHVYLQSSFPFFRIWRP
jgi:hypothetical protein